MAQCSNCGFELDDRRALPPSCPRCGATTGSPQPSGFGPPTVDTPGAPPDFDFEPDAVPGTTLFGVPQLGEAELGSGPPGIDLGGEPEGEIDLPGLPAAPRRAAPRTGIKPPSTPIPQSIPRAGGLPPLTSAQRSAPTPLPNAPPRGTTTSQPPPPAGVQRPPSFGAPRAAAPSPPRAQQGAAPPRSAPTPVAAPPRPSTAPPSFSTPRAPSPASRGGTTTSQPVPPASFSSPQRVPAFSAPRMTPLPGDDDDLPQPRFTAPATFSAPRPNPTPPPRGGSSTPQRPSVPAAIPRPPTPPTFDPVQFDDLPSPVRAPAGRGRVPMTPTPAPTTGHSGDLDFHDDDGFLELDIPIGRPTPLPGELDLPTAHTAGDLGALDLPTPVHKPTPEPRRPPSFGPQQNDGLTPRRGPGPKAPPPPPAHGQAFATPGVDLPPPSRFDVPAQPRRGSVPPLRQLDLPAPDALDLPQPIGLDLPTPSDVDLPMPIGLDLEPVNNMLQPASLELEPQGGNWVAPAELGVQPADLNVQPAELGVEPANLGVEPANLGLAPFARAKPVDDVAPGEAVRRRGPAVREIERQGVSRGLLYGGAALLLVGAFAAVLLYTGVFDEEIPPPPPPDPANEKDGKAEKTVAPAAERSEAILAQLAADTPKAYADAAEAAKAADDRLGYAEALLLLSHRYGPDVALVAQAAELVKPYAKNTEPFVTRVRGLVAIAGGDTEGATTLLAGESPREQLYRGFILLAQGKHDDAIAAATAVLAADDTSIAALHLQHAGGVAKDASKELPLLEASAKKHPDHPGLQELRLRAGIQLGHLATATDALAKILAVEGAPTPFLARRATLEGMLAAAQGDLITAAAKYDAALALSPGNLDARVGKIRTLLAAGNVQALLPEIKALATERPTDPTVALLRVEVAIAAGNFDEAITMLDGLDKTLPDRVEVPFFRGQVHAMRMQVDEAKAAFAKALEKDPQFWAASLAEAEMLGAARMPVEAVAVLDAALRRANEAGASGPVQSKLLFAKAKLLARQGQTAAALAALDTAMDVDPTSNDAQVLRGQLRLDAGDPDAGKADLVAVYERTGGYPGLAGPLGRIFVSEGKIEEAQKLVGDGADDERAPVDVKLVAARIEIAKRNPDAAKTHLSHVLAQDGANWEAQMLMAEAFLVAGDAAEALARINQAQPGTAQPELHVLKGKILEYNGRHTEARPEYLLALKIDPTRHEARFLYGRLLAYDGAAGSAKAELAQVVEATGDRFPEAWLNLGRAQRELGENDDAIKSLAKATSLEPTLQEGFYLEGRIHADRNKHSKAIELFEKATAGEVKGEWVPAAWASLGRAQAKAGQNGAAKASFKKFLEIALPNDPSRDEAERQVRTL